MHEIYREEDQPSAVHIDLLTKRSLELFYLSNFRNYEELASQSSIETISCRAHRLCRFVDASFRTRLMSERMTESQIA